MTLQFDIAAAGNLAVAGLAGLAVGIEREWSGHASGRGARFAGARTMLLLGLLGGLAGWLFGGDLVLPGSLVLAAGVALTVAAYVMAARGGASSVEGTTEVAALVVLTVGTAAGLGFPLLTSAVTAVVVLALSEKTRIHAAINRLGEKELGAALQFAVLALVVLPMLPTGPYGPFDAIRPRMLWISVLIFSGLNFVGYLARRAVGNARGYSFTGLLGGLVSSTGVTLLFSRQSRHEPALGAALGSGVIGACTVLLPRVLAVSTALHPAVGWALLPYLVPALVVGIGMVLLALRRPEQSKSQSEKDDRSPLGLWSALQMAAVFQILLLAVPFVRQTWGSPGVLASAALLGLADMDALTFAMARLPGGDGAVALGAKAIAIGILSNTLLKLALTLVLGTARFRRVASTGLVILAAASLFGLWLAS